MFKFCEWRITDVNQPQCIFSYSELSAKYKWIVCFSTFLTERIWSKLCFVCQCKVQYKHSVRNTATLRLEKHLKEKAANWILYISYVPCIFMCIVFFSWIIWYCVYWETSLYTEPPIDVVACYFPTILEIHQ